MVILQARVPLQPVLPAVGVEQRNLVAATGCGVIEADFLHLAVAHIHIKYLRLVGQVGGGA